MLNTRGISTDFWRDEFVISLTPLEKYLYNYLITNPRASLCGVYRLQIHTAACELGIEEELIVKVLGFFQECGKLIYDKETDEVFLLGWYKCNREQYDAHEESMINAELRLIQSSRLIMEFHRAYAAKI